MAEQLTNVVWMAEELDFDLDPARRPEAMDMLDTFLDSAGNPELEHRIVSPVDNLDSLHDQLESIHTEKPFTFAIDLTRGKLSDRLELADSQVPTWRDFSISRVRTADKPELPTAGHLVSHSKEEIRAVLADVDTSHVLVLDDTAFSGTTSTLIEEMFRDALSDREVDFTHGFLILNTGDLGPAPGSKRRIEAQGSQAVGGMEIRTPRDDGWHIFDIVRQGNDLPQHLAAVLDLSETMRTPGAEAQVEEMLADEAQLRRIFPESLDNEHLARAQKAGRFLTTQQLNGGLYVRNPQLLPAITAQGHLLPPNQWRDSTANTLTSLEKLAGLFDGSNANG